MIEVESAGPLCSVQDGGRIGWRRIGLPRSGALDPLALAVANALVSNHPDAPAIELMASSLSLTAIAHPVRLALAGADVTANVDGEPIALHCSFVLHPGERLRIGAARRGLVAMLACEGGFRVPMALGSAALHVRSGVGGGFGRTLRPGDRIPTAPATVRCYERALPALPLAATAPLRVVLGPQDQMFAPSEIERLTSAEFSVSQSVDRMAYRLTGPPIEAQGAATFVSDGIVEGALQVAGSGELIVPLADCQTVGGYPKIATLATVDRRLLAQSPPGTRLRFTIVTVAEAQVLLIERRRLIAGLPAMLKPVAPRSAAGEIDAEALWQTADCAVSAMDVATWDRSGLERFGV